MSKIIKVTPDMYDQLRADFEKSMMSSKFPGGRFSFDRVFDTGRKSARVHYTLDAWFKQSRVLKEFDKEVAWHGVAARGEDAAGDDYYITDIVVYPQTVTASSVDMDEVEYGKWKMENDADPRFSSLYMQAHSHVNIGTTPSAVDLKHQSDILSMLGEDDFYIFMIWNKSMSHTVCIYDMRKNTLFENADVEVLVDGAQVYDDFIKDAKSMVKDTLYKPSAAGTYTGSYPAPSGAKPYNPVSQPPAPADKPAEKPRTRIAGGRTVWDDDDDAFDDYLRRRYGDGYADPYYYNDK